MRVLFAFWALARNIFRFLVAEPAGYTRFGAAGTVEEFRHSNSLGYARQIHNITLKLPRVRTSFHCWSWRSTPFDAYICSTLHRSLIMPANILRAVNRAHPDQLASPLAGKTMHGGWAELCCDYYCNSETARGFEARPRVT